MYGTGMLCALLLCTATISYADVPDWLRDTAGWWAEGAISDVEFVGAIQYMADTGIIQIMYNEQTDTQSDEIPGWLRDTAGWWAEGVISDVEFVGAIQYMADMGIIQVTHSEQVDDTLASLEAELAACSQYTKAYQRIDCEDEVERRITTHTYMSKAEPYTIGPITYWYPGATLEMASNGQPLLTIRILAYNDGTDNVTLMCSGPAVCNYHISDGTNAYRYASTDFVSGSITVKPGEGREFEMLFGPNIGYGGTTFVYDDTKLYDFVISEGFGSGTIPLGLD